MPPDRRDYAALLAVYRTALLTTRGADGHLRSRPMAMRQAVRGEEIWFATSAASNKCRDLDGDPRCALTFFDAEDGTTVSISGRGEVILDRKLAMTLWDPSWTRWFPRGPAQPGLTLVRVIPEHVERHDGMTGRATVLFSASRRRATRTAAAARRGALRSRRPASAPRRGR
jgi:general stress protein 26